MLHIRVVSPPSLSGKVIAQLESHVAVHNLVVLPGAARHPVGDLIQFDVAREGANQIIADLRDLDLHTVGSITLERIDTSLSEVARVAEQLSPGAASEAVVWEEVEARVRDESALTSSFVVMMTVAMLIGAVGILLDSSVLIVGAMVVGPDYGPLAGVMLGIHRRRLDRAGQAASTLLIGFGVGALACTAFGVVVRAIDRVPASYIADTRPLTQFISRPDGWSIVVALLAGVAGMIAMTEAKAGTLVGVLISVTTVPAAANAGVAASMQRWSEAAGAGIQLVTNVLVVCLAGIITLRVEQRLSGVPIRSRRRKNTDPADTDTTDSDTTDSEAAATTREKSAPVHSDEPYTGRQRIDGAITPEHPEERP